VVTTRSPCFTRDLAGSFPVRRLPRRPAHLWPGPRFPLRLVCSSARVSDRLYDCQFLAPVAVTAGPALRSYPLGTLSFSACNQILCLCGFRCAAAVEHAPTATGRAFRIRHPASGRARPAAPGAPAPDHRCAGRGRTGPRHAHRDHASAGARRAVRHTLARRTISSKRPVPGPPPWRALPDHHDAPSRCSRLFSGPALDRIQHGLMSSSPARCWARACSATPCPLTSPTRDAAAPRVRSVRISRRGSSRRRSRRGCCPLNHAGDANARSG